MDKIGYISLISPRFGGLTSMPIISIICEEKQGVIDNQILTHTHIGLTHILVFESCQDHCLPECLLTCKCMVERTCSFHSNFYSRFLVHSRTAQRGGEIPMGLHCGLYMYIPNNPRSSLPDVAEARVARSNFKTFLGLLSKQL